MSIILTLFCVLTFFLPGLAFVSVKNRLGSVSERTIFAPFVSSIFFGIAGLVGWIFPACYGIISWITIVFFSLFSFYILQKKAGRDFIKQIDPVIPFAYISLVLVTTQIAFLPVKIPSHFPKELDFTYFVREDVLPVKIQALHHHLPNDNILPFRFAQFLLRGVDFSKPREEPYGDYPSIAPGQAVTARTPLMALIGAQYLKFFVPDIQTDGQYGRLGAFLNDYSYHRFFLIACVLNALLILPAYLFAERISGKKAARITLMLLALNYSILIETNFIWPKALAGYFALLFAYMVITGKISPLISSTLIAMAYYSHQCAIGLVAGASVLFLWKNLFSLKSLSQIFLTALLSIVFVSPWSLWSHYGVGISGNLISQNFFQNADSGWLYMAEIRFSNIIKSLIPHQIAQGDIISNQNLFATVFFTLPGSLGLIASIFFISAVTLKNAGSLIFCLCIIPVIITSLMFGQSHGGLMPFGPFIFIPLAMVFVVSGLMRLEVKWKVFFLLIICLEQALLIWFSAIKPQWIKFDQYPLTQWIRLTGIYAVIALTSFFSLLLSVKYRNENNIKI